MNFSNLCFIQKELKTKEFLERLAPWVKISADDILISFS